MEITQPIFIGTEEVTKELKSISSFNNDTSSVVLLTCFPNTETLNFHDNNSVLASDFKSHVIEVSSNLNPFTGDTHSFSDPLKNNSAFAKDNLTYPDYRLMNIKRYELTTNSISEFTRTFPQNDLKESQLSAAITAFHIQELGHKFTIIIQKEETELLQFCKQQNWDYFLLT